MSLEAAAAAMGLPEALVQRSAAARAAETGQSVDEILAAWAGGEALPETTPQAADEAPEPVAEETAGPVDEAPEAPVVEVPQVEPVAAAVATRAPVPDEVTAAEATRLPEVVTVPTAGIKERTNFVIPRWLTAVMLIVPLFALFALGGASTGECGEATELDTNVVTGQIVNCDGSEFTGSQVGGGGTDFLALGEDIYNGTAVSGVNCAGCHGANGQGQAAFPALTGALTTFGECTDHIEWVNLGSGGYTSQGTYGDTNKPVQGGMPGFSGSLSPEQVAAVSAFERVRFAGEDADLSLADCGLVDPSTDSTVPGDESSTDGGEGGEMEEPAEAAAGLSG